MGAVHGIGYDDGVVFAGGSLGAGWATNDVPTAWTVYCVLGFRLAEPPIPFLSQSQAQPAVARFPEYETAT